MAKETPEWLTRQRAAIKRQAEAHAAIAPGDGTLIEVAGLRYTRGQAVDALAQYRNCLAADAFLPNAGANGLTIDPGTVRNPLDDKARSEYEANVVQLAPQFTDDEVSEADARLAANLAEGVSLDPTTAENTDMSTGE